MTAGLQRHSDRSTGHVEQNNYGRVNVTDRLTGSGKVHDRNKIIATEYWNFRS